MHLKEESKVKKKNENETSFISTYILLNVKQAIYRGDK